MRGKLLILFLAIIALIASISGCTDIGLTSSDSKIQTPESNITRSSNVEAEDSGQSDIKEDEQYSSKDEVAMYIKKYKKLPSNFITKKEAISLGWQSSKGNLWDVREKSSIGGDYFGNFEGKLPKEKGRKWYECDINYNGGFRGAERILYSNDGLIYYTNDHYKTFKQLLK